ncbi:MAG: methyltransferase domain-containing protein [Rickettsiales endosymbiont of Dermacentor nuttalli]
MNYNNRNIILRLNNFYAGDKGQKTYKCINNAISTFWHNIKNEKILGIGYTSIYIQNFLNNYLISANPFYPYTDSNILGEYIRNNNTNIMDCAIQEDALPFSNNAINRIMLIHCIEYSSNIHQLMKEVWRILIPGGKLLIVVPNKFSILSYVETDFFKRCNSFSIGQLYNLLYEHMFVPISTSSALFGVSNLYSTLLPFHSILEHTGQKSLLPFGGLLLIESTKLMYASRQKFPKPRKMVFNPHRLGTQNNRHNIMQVFSNS